MKKVVGLLSSLLVFSGIKAQTNTPVKKETTKPDITRTSPADSLKAIKGNTNVKATDKAIKIGQLKNTTSLPMKENTQPIKAGTLPVKVSTVPLKENTVPLKTTKTTPKPDKQ